MSPSQLLSYRDPASHYLTGDEDTITEATQVQAILDVLEDETSREILRLLDGESLSASELATKGDIPLSTTYRKLNALTETRLVDERIRILRSGRHTSEYSRAFDDVTISLGPDAGAAIELVR